MILPCENKLKRKESSPKDFTGIKEASDKTTMMKNTFFILLMLNLTCKSAKLRIVNMPTTTVNFKRLNLKSYEEPL